MTWYSGMMGHKALLVAAGALFAVMWAGGIASYLVRGAPPPGATWTAPAFLALGAAICLLAVERRYAVRLLAAAALGWGAEALGVWTGVPFGHYRYTGALGPGLLGVPFAMAAAWLLLVCYATHLWGGARNWRPVWVGCAAAWLVMIDLLIDPVAAGPLGFWRWQHPGAYYGVPAGNFAGWFVVGACAVLAAGPPKRSSPWVLGVGSGIVAFFAVLALSHGLWFPGWLGLVLCISQVPLWRRGRRTQQ